MIDTKRIVVKIGTSSLTYENGRINLHRMDTLCRVLTDLRNRGHEILLVTSAALAVGSSSMGLEKRPTDTVTRQAMAAVGQCELMFMYDKLFGDYGQTVAQVLLTKNVTDLPLSRSNVQNTFSRLLELGVIPIINENDTVETIELEGDHYGDNDMLSAIVAEIVAADMLVIFTDTDGLFDSDPRENPDAKIIEELWQISPEIEELAGAGGSNRGTGGMATKLRAAGHSMNHGVDCYITNGNKIKALYDILRGSNTGTKFYSEKKSADSFK